MRKLIFVLLFILLLVVTGCSENNPVQSDAGSVSDTMVSEITTPETDPYESAASETDNTSAPVTEPPAPETEMPSVPAETKPKEEISDSEEQTTTSPPPQVENKPPAEASETTEPDTSHTEIPQEPETSETTNPPEQTPETSQTTTDSPVTTDPPKQTTEEPKETEPIETEPPITTEPPVETPPPEVTEPKEDTFTEADHERIIAEVTAYAESYADKGFTFEWKESMTFGWEIGYMGTPRIKYDGVDGVIKTLKHHVDLIYKTSTNPQYGITTDYMTYKVEQITIDGDLAYVVIYGG